MYKYFVSYVNQEGGIINFGNSIIDVDEKVKDETGVVNLLNKIDEETEKNNNLIISYCLLSE